MWKVSECLHKCCRLVDSQQMPCVPLEQRHHHAEEGCRRTLEEDQVKHSHCEREWKAPAVEPECHEPRRRPELVDK